MLYSRKKQMPYPSSCKFKPIEKLRLLLDNVQGMSLHKFIPLVPLFSGEVK
jgi:hypothetical protein